MDKSKSAGLSRIRLVAGIVAAVMFGMTAVEQFRGQEPGTTAFGVLVSAILGFGIVWIVMTIVIVIIRLFRRDG